MTNDEIKADIIEACSEAIGLGFELMTMIFNRQGICGGCAMTAVAFVRCNVDPASGKTEPMFAAVMNRYGWSRTQCWDFARGFDGYDGGIAPGGSTEFTKTAEYAIGRAVRAEVQP